MPPSSRTSVSDSGQPCQPLRTTTKSDPNTVRASYSFPAREQPPWVRPLTVCPASRSLAATRSKSLAVGGVRKTRMQVPSGRSPRGGRPNPANLPEPGGQGASVEGTWPSLALATGCLRGGGGGAEARGCSPFGGPIGMSRGGGGPCRPARRGEVSGAPRTRRTPRSPRWVRRAVRSSGRYWPPRMSSAWPTRVTCLATPGVGSAPEGSVVLVRGGGPGCAGRRALRRTPGPRRRRGLVRGWCRGWWWPRLRSG